MTTRYAGRCFLYVLVASGPEDLLKVGMTHDPLVRWSSFHARWFEAFDLEHSLLVETETRADAQALETALHRRLVDHQCPVPLTMHVAAGGVTEWYRGASQAAHLFVQECERQGHVVHLQARHWLAPAMAQMLERLHGLVFQAFAEHCAGRLGRPQAEAIRALVDAHHAFGADIEGMFPLHVRRELRLPG